MLYSDENIWPTQKMMGILYDVETHTIKAYLMDDESIKTAGPSSLTEQHFEEQLELNQSWRTIGQKIINKSLVGPGQMAILLPGNIKIKKKRGRKGYRSQVFISFSHHF